MKDYNGPERRKNLVSTEHRLTKLESGIETLHARFSQFDHEQKYEVRTLGETILEKLDKKEADCVEHKKQTAKLETFGMLVEKLAYVFGAAITAIGTWIFAHHDKIKAVK